MEKFFLLYLKIIVYYLSNYPLYLSNYPLYLQQPKFTPSKIKTDIPIFVCSRGDVGVYISESKMERGREVYSFPA